MANISVSQKFQVNKPVSADEIKTFIRKRLDQSCKYKVIAEDASSFSITGSVKESVFVTAAKFKAIIGIKIEGDRVRINAEGNSTANWVFWVFFVAGLFTGVFILLAFALYLMQRDKPTKAIEAIMKAVDDEFGVI